jgi:hypothetical protein
MRIVLVVRDRLIALGAELCGLLDVERTIFVAWISSPSLAGFLLIVTWNLDGTHDIGEFKSLRALDCLLESGNHIRPSGNVGALDWGKWLAGSKRTGQMG